MRHLLSRTLPSAIALAIALLPHTARASTAQLIRSAGSPIYWQENDARFSFADDATFKSWFPNKRPTTVLRTTSALAKLPLNGQVSYRPGADLIKFSSSPRVYAVSRLGVLRWISSPHIASALYGSTWTTRIRELSDAHYPSFTIGGALYDEAEFHPNEYLRDTPSANLLTPASRPPAAFTALLDLRASSHEAFAGQTLTLSATTANTDVTHIRIYDPQNQVLASCTGSNCTATIIATGPLGLQTFIARGLNRFEQSVDSVPVNVTVRNP